MNEGQFRKRMIGLTLFYILVVGVSVVIQCYGPCEPSISWYDGFSELIPLIIAIPAPMIVYWVQRRLSYLKNVSDLYSNMVNTVQDVIQYTHLEKPNQEDFGKVHKSISVTIDKTRAVFSNIDEKFSNIDENENNKGYFPFESLKNIARILDGLKFGATFTPATSSVARKNIVCLWGKIRNHLLPELPRGIPTKPDSPFGKDHVKKEQIGSEESGH